MKVNGQWVPRGRNSSYSFILILLKLYRCYDHALKICMWFGYNPQTNFSYILSHFSFFLTMKVNGLWVPHGRNSSYSFIVPHLFEEKRRDIVFGFPSFLPSFCPSVLPSPYRSMYLVGATPPAVLFRFF